MTRPSSTLILGSVAYDPKVVTIWDGFRRWFLARDLPFTYVLYAHYEHQVEDLVAGHIHVAWNSPLAWIRASRLTAARSVVVQPIAMRDSDRDLTSAVVVRSDSAIHSVADLRGRVIGTGAVDSPQATLIPLDYIRQAGLVPGKDFAVRRFDVGVGMHGDHVGGEREAARALMRGELDATCMLDANNAVFAREGTLPAGSTRVLGQTTPFDHCMMTAGPDAPRDLIRRFTDLLLSMSYDDPEVRPLLDLEGLKSWLPGRTGGYGPLSAAVDALGFLDEEGNLIADDYRP